LPFVVPKYFHVLAASQMWIVTVIGIRLPSSAPKVSSVVTGLP
jgi:hypothetical protein